MSFVCTSAFVRCLRAAAVLLVLAVGGGVPPAAARGGAAVPPKPPVAPVPAEPKGDAGRGGRYFSQSAAWIGHVRQGASSGANSGAKQGLRRVRDFYADLHDVQFRQGDSSHEVRMRIWLQEPDKYRVEVRRNKMSTEVTTKILSCSQMWIVDAKGSVQRVHGSQEGAAAVAQLQQDRKQLMGLARFLTLQGPVGPKVRFLHEDTTTVKGLLAGQWLKVRRVSPSGPDMIFRFAYSRDPATQALTALQPGVVTIAGDTTRDATTEHYLLQRWKQGPAFRYPGRIQAYSKAARPGAKMKRFLVAFPNDIRVNSNLAPAIFAPPRK